jgi:hypothetical protein
MNEREYKIAVALEGVQAACPEAARVLRRELDRLRAPPFWEDADSPLRSLVDSDVIVRAVVRVAIDTGMSERECLVMLATQLAGSRADLIDRLCKLTYTTAAPMLVFTPTKDQVTRRRDSREGS